MTDKKVDRSAVIAAAETLADKDVDALELQLGLRAKLIEEKPELENVPDLSPKYEPHMGLLDDLKSLGRRIAARWSKELHGVVCGGSGDEGDRQKILNALNLGEAAVIAAVAGALIGLTVPPPLAAAAAPLIVKRFIWPARDELCEAWGEALVSV